MLLCGLVRTVLSASLGCVVQLVIVLLQNSNISRVQGSLPPGAEDEIILIEHLPGRRVHLQDFFWTGVDDAPPWIDPNQGLTFYETRTVYHTVTVYPSDESKDPATRIGPPGADDSHSHPYDPECKSCIEPTPRLDEDGDDDQSIGILVGDDPGPRYWLLTVLREGEAVPPKVELKLARLYRAAFSRQQQRHLGVLSTDPRARRAAIKRASLGEKVPLKNVQEDKEESEPSAALALAPTSTPTSTPKSEMRLRSVRSASHPGKVKMIKMVEVPKFKRTLPANFYSGDREDQDDFLSINLNSDGGVTGSFRNNVLSPTSNLNTTSPSLSNRHEIWTTESDRGGRRNPSEKRGSAGGSEGDRSEVGSANLSSPILNSRARTKPRSVDSRISNGTGSASARSRLRSSDHTIHGIVQVRMQNTTVTESGATKLIYSVHLGGKPVPAETAARDMALLSPQEVALELGAPVIVQSEPYLKESTPLALSRRRDAWLLIGTAIASVFLLAVIIATIILLAKRKKANSAVAAPAPSSRSILKKDREYAGSTPGLDNAGFSTSETDAKTDGTSQRQTPGTLSRTLVTPETPSRSDAEGLHDVSSENEEESPKRKARRGDIQEQPAKKPRISHGRMTRTNAVDPPITPDSVDTVDDHVFDSLENGYVRQEEGAASPRSYLSMPSCKQFPSMRSVEPLSRVLEPVMVRHLDVDSPDPPRRRVGDIEDQREETVDDRFLVRASSAMRDPGVVGPIVWNLRRQGLSYDGTGTSETDCDPTSMVPAGPVGRARRRLHELLEDSFSLFGTRESKVKEAHPTPPIRSTSAAGPPDVLAIFSETRGRSAHVSPVATPTSELRTRPRTSISRRGFEEQIPETGIDPGPGRPRGAWGSRPMSAGPFHRPNLPEVDAKRILTDAQLPPEDPAVPLIASIKKELEKFSAH